MPCLALDVLETAIRISPASPPVKARNAFFHAMLRACQCALETGNKLRSHSRGPAKLVQYRLGLKTSNEIANSRAWHVLRYLASAQRRFGPCPANTLESFRFSLAFTLMVGAASAQVPDQPRPQPGAPGAQAPEQPGRSRARQRSRAESICRASEAGGADRSW